MRVPRMAKPLLFAGSMVLVIGATYRISRLAPLPRYELRIEGGRATYLDPQQVQHVQVLDTESRISIILRPDHATPRRVFVSAVVKEQSISRTWPVVFERTPPGALLLQGPLRELRLPCQQSCTVILYVSDFALIPALLLLVPESYRSRLLPRTQVLQASVFIERPILPVVQ